MWLPIEFEKKWFSYYNYDFAFSQHISKIISVEHVHIWNTHFYFNDDNELIAKCRILVHQRVLDTPVFNLEPPNMTVVHISSDIPEGMCFNTQLDEGSPFHILSKSGVLCVSTGREISLTARYYLYKHPYVQTFYDETILIGKVDPDGRHIRIIEGGAPYFNGESIPIKDEYKIYNATLKYTQNDWYFVDLFSIQ